MDNIKAFFLDCFKGDKAKNIFFILAIAIFLIWLPFQYGGRYIITQTAGQVICGGLLLVLYREYKGNYFKYPLWAISLFWIGVLTISTFFSVSQLSSLEELLRNIMYICLPIVIFGWTDSKNRIKLLSYLIIFVGLSVSLYALYEGFKVYLITGQFQYIEAPFSRNNDLGAYLLLIFPLSFSNFLYENDSSLEKAFYGLVGLLSFIVIILTFSRGIWLTLLISLILIFSIGYKVLRKNSIFLVFLGIISIIPIVINWDSITRRFISIQNIFTTAENSMEWRKSLLEGSINIFLENPVIGNGINTFSVIYRKYQLKVGYFSINPHNYYVQLLAETGIVGLITFIVLGLSIIYLSFKAFKNSEAIFKGISLGLVIGIISSLIHISLDIDWSVSAIPSLFWIEVGLLMAIYNLVNFRESRYSNLKFKFEYLKSPIIILFGISIITLPILNYSSLETHAKAYSYFQQGYLKEAKATNLKAMKLAPLPSAKHHYFQALILKKEGKFDEAIGMVEKSLKINKYDYRSYQEYSDLLLYKKNSKDKALFLLKESVSYNPYVHPSLYEKVGDFYLDNYSDQKSAIEWYTKAIETFPIKRVKRYERFSLSDRYELIRIFKKLANLIEITNSKKAEEYRNSAVMLLNTQRKAKNHTEGTETPTSIIKNYWKNVNIPGKNINDYLIEGENIIEPSKEYNYKFIDFINIERDFFSGSVEYKVLIKNDKQSKEFVIIDDILETKNGWRIRKRSIKG